METSTATTARTDASLVYEILIRREAGQQDERHVHHPAAIADWDAFDAILSEWDCRYSTQQDG